MMYTHAAPAIGLPRFKMSDASVGVRTWGPTTAYAGGAALAATWDTDFARKLGESLGKDARVRSVNFLLGPGREHCTVCRWRGGTLSTCLETLPECDEWWCRILRGFSRRA